MIVAFDAGMLSILIHPNATIPDDPATGKPLASAKERIEHLIESIEARNGTIVIPTPALSEFLVVVDTAGASYLRLLRTHACFDIQPFDERAAIECAESQRLAFAEGDKKSGATGTYQKSKVDRQIVSVAKCCQVDRIYTTDKDVVNIATFCKVPVTAVWNLPLPPSEEPAEDTAAVVESDVSDPARPPFEGEEGAAIETADASPPNETAPPSGLSVFVDPETKPDSAQARPSVPQDAQAPLRPDSSPTVAPPPQSEQ